MYIIPVPEALKQAEMLAKTYHSVYARCVAEAVFHYYAFDPVQHKLVLRTRMEDLHARWLHYLPAGSSTGVLPVPFAWPESLVHASNPDLPEPAVPVSERFDFRVDPSAGGALKAIKHGFTGQRFAIRSVNETIAGRTGTVSEVKIDLNPTDLDPTHEPIYRFGVIGFYVTDRVSR